MMRAKSIGWLVAWVLAGSAAPLPAERLAIGMTGQSLVGVALPDAKLATKSWAESITSERGMDLEVHVEIYRGDADLRRALEKKQVDLAVLGTPTFFALGGYDMFDSVFLYERGGSASERYRLMARRDGPIAALADLRGRHLIVLDNVRTSLAQVWLDSALREQSSPATEQLVRQMTREHKSSKCVLDVFFRNADACLVTAQGFDTLAELNPQMAQDMVVLEESPPFTPSVCALRRDYHAPARKDIERAIVEAHRTTSGQQVLHVYMIDRLVPVRADELASTQALLREAEEAAGPSRLDTAANPGEAQP